MDSIEAGNLLGGSLGRLALGVAIVAVTLLMLLFGLTSIGFSAMLGAAGGLDTTSSEPARQSIVGPTVPSALAPTVALAGTTSTATNAPNVSGLLDLARSWLGTRYVFGGCSPAGIDCSCFVQTIFQSIGISLPRTSQQQFNATVGRGLGTSTPQPGDLVFFFHTYTDPGQDWTHVGVVSRVDTNGIAWMIDAPGARAAGDPPDAPFGRVREEPIAGSWLQHRPTYARIPV
jgi:cell wall-associated NlpC family hydrolase